VPQVRDYFSNDAITAVEKAQGDFTKLGSTSPTLNVFPPLLMIIGIIVVIDGALLSFLVRMTRKEGASTTVPSPPKRPVHA
jgi:hypothetical protein